MEVGFEVAAGCYKHEEDDHQALEALQSASLLLISSEDDAIDKPSYHSDAEPNADAEEIIREGLLVGFVACLGEQLGFWHDLQAVDGASVHPLEEVVNHELAEDEADGRGHDQAQDVELAHDYDHSWARERRG